MPTDKRPDPQPEKKSWRVADVVQREHFTMLEPMEPVNLTDEQKTWRVADVVQRERFTMLEPMEPVNLTDEQKTWPVAEGREAAPEVGATDLATLRRLIDRYGANHLRRLIGTIAAGGPEGR